MKTEGLIALLKQYAGQANAAFHAATNVGSLAELQDFFTQALGAKQRVRGGDVTARTSP